MSAPQLPAVVIHAVRQAHETDMPISKICSENDITKRQYYACIGALDLPDGARLPALAPRGANRQPSMRAAPPRARLVTRLWRTAERQVSEIESRLNALPGDAMSLERDAKTLAVIARTVRDLVALDEAPRGAPNESLGAHDDMPRDIDEFRRELARRMEAFVHER